MLRAILLIVVAAVTLTTSLAIPARAATIPTDDFSLEVSPSPLVATVKPGVPVTLDFKIRNASLKAEQLKIETRSFRIAYPDQNIVIGNSAPPDLVNWVSYASPKFTIEPGEWFTQKVKIHLPDAAGFSYPFVIVVSRANEPIANTSGRILKGSIGAFALINVDKPGATRKLELSDFEPTQSMYEFLPAEFTIRLKNTGNSIVQPYGNVYIQKNKNDTEPLSVLPVNEGRGYVLPGNTKTITAAWSDGFPYYKQTGTTKDGKAIRSLTWQLKNSDKLRFGKYTAKIVAVYNDGSRDVPITGEVSFWVIPWRIIGGAAIVIGLLGLGVWSLLRRFKAGFSRIKRRS